MGVFDSRLQHHLMKVRIYSLQNGSKRGFIYFAAAFTAGVRRFEASEVSFRHLGRM